MTDSPTREQAEAMRQRAENVLTETESWQRANPDAASLARDVAALLAAVSLLVTERDALQKALDRLVERFEHDFTRGDYGWQMRQALDEADVALAGGGRTPAGDDTKTQSLRHSGGLGWSAEPVAEEGETWPKRPDVAGRCPACGRSSLFLADGGYVTCRIAECPDPCAAANALLTPATVSPPESVSPGAADVAEAGE